MEEIETLYEVYWDESPGVEEGWVARRTEREGVDLVSQEDTPLDTEDREDIAGAKAEAARYWEIDANNIRAVEFWTDETR